MDGDILKIDGEERCRHSVIGHDRLTKEAWCEDCNKELDVFELWLASEHRNQVIIASLASKCDTCIKAGGPPELLRGVDFSLDGKGEG